MTNPRLPKPLIHSPPTPPPAKQIHISHKTPSPSTTPRTSITTRTSNAAESLVPVSSPSATNTQVTLNTTIATPTATALSTETQHMDRVVPNFDMTRTNRTAHTANTASIHKPSSNNERNLIILQVNINGINNKLEELKTLIKNKLLQTSTSGTILKFIVNYIKGRKAYTSFRNHKSIQRQVKTGVLQGGVLSPTLFNIHTADIPTPTAPVQVMLYADDITITSTHTSMSAARKYIQPYLHKGYDWTQHNNLIINPDKTTSTLFTPDPAEYNSNLGLNINNKALPMALHPKVLGLTLDPKLTYNAHIQNIATHAQKPSYKSTHRYNMG